MSCRTPEVEQQVLGWGVGQRHAVGPARVTRSIAAVVALVAVSRLYLQVHYPTDAVAGLVLAAVWVLGLAATLPRVPPSTSSN